MPNSTSLYLTFGNEVKYSINQDTLVAYLENATIKFPLPEAGTDLLVKLTDQNDPIDAATHDQVTQQLVYIGFGEPNAKAMASVLLRVAKVQNVHPMTYFDLNSNTLRLAIDAYDAINSQRPVGNRIGLKTPLSNSTSRYSSLIQP